MQAGKGVTSVRLATAAVVLIAVVLLRAYEIPPIPTWFYVLAWYPTLIILDEVVVLLGGESLLARPRGLALMLWWSAVIWFLFEAINFRLRDWYYVFLPAGRLERWLGITVSLAAVLAFPRYLYPLTWGAVWLIAEPLLYRRDPAHSLFADMTHGSWGRIARLMAAGLFAGVLWESFNAIARGRWIYTVPFLEHLKIFEMPLVGFLGFPFFALEVWSLYHLVAPHTNRRTLLGSAAFVVLVLIGIDHWTVSSTTPALRDLPGVTNAVISRLQAAGWDNVFRVARSPVAELAYRANLSPRDARTAQDAARLVTLRGIGTAHAAALIGGGVGSVEALAASDPDSVWEMVRAGGGGARPTPAEVRVWVRAAQRQARPTLPSAPGRPTTHPPARQPS